VYAYYEDSKKYEFLGNDLLASYSKPLESELKYILGEENVVIRL
jgi:hypothetical protein